MGFCSTGAGMASTRALVPGLSEAGERMRGREAVSLAQDLVPPFNQALVSAYMALLQQLCADEAVAREHAEQALALTIKYQATYYRAWAGIFIGYALALEQPDEEHIGRLRGSIN